MKTAIIRSSWMKGYGYRLDTHPYVGGALQTKILLEKLPLRKDPLHTLTKGHEGGIYNGPQFCRNYVEDSKNGVPFLTGSSMQLADLSNVSLLSRKDALGSKLRHLRLEQGMTLISCSGSIGKMAYVRPEMAGIWSSQDILKVVPDPAKIPSGYLYAFLSSKFGVPLVASGTYGAIIQHLEPEHIADIDVPRLDPAKEQEIHNLVETAARLRSEASELKSKAIHLFYSTCDVPVLKDMSCYISPKVGVAKSSIVASRFDSTYYYPPAVDARISFDTSIAAHSGKLLGDVAEIFIPPIFKRGYADDPNHGVPYITGADLFSVRPTSELYLQVEVASQYNLKLNHGMILIHEAGSRNGLIGHSAFVHKSTHGWACTNNMVRVAPYDIQDSGYIFTVLSSEAGIRLLKREAAGSAIPHLDERRVKGISIPWPKPDIRMAIANIMIQSQDNYDAANLAEDEYVEKLNHYFTKD